MTPSDQGPVTGRRPPWATPLGAFAIAAAALAFAQGALQLAWPLALEILLAKEGPVEHATVLVSAVTVIACLVYRGRGVFFTLGLLASVLFILEETSWFREFVRYDTPACMLWFNAEGDLNFHNRTSSGLDLMLLFRGAFGLVFMVLPWLPWVRRHARIGPLLPPPAPGVVFVVYAVWATFTHHVLPGAAGAAEVGDVLQEALELVAAGAILCAVLQRGRAATGGAPRRA